MNTQPPTYEFTTLKYLPVTNRLSGRLKFVNPHNKTFTVPRDYEYEFLSQALMFLKSQGIDIVGILTINPDQFILIHSNN